MGVLGHITDEDQPFPKRVHLKLPNDQTKRTLNGDGHVYEEVEEHSVDHSIQEEVCWVACGQQNSGVVVKGRSDGYQLYMWGEGATGVIGNGKIEPQLSPTLVKVHIPEFVLNPTPSMAQLAIGLKHAICLSVDGDAYSWGNNSFGKGGHTFTICIR